MAEEIIAVMGATGAGKSSFIKMVTEDEGVVIGHGLTSGEHYTLVSRSNPNFLLMCYIRNPSHHTLPVVLCGTQYSPR